MECFCFFFAWITAKESLISWPKLFFPGKVLFWGFWCECGQSWPKWDFEVLWKVSGWSFSDFCKKCQQHKGLKLRKTFFDKIIVFRFFWEKNPKGPKFGFFKFNGEWEHVVCLIFWIKLHHYEIALNNCFCWNHLN